MSRKRNFVNHYDDYLKNEEIKVDRTYLANHIAELALITLNRTLIDAESCDGSIYTGNVGLVYMIDRLLVSSIAPQYQKELVEYALESIDLNEKYFAAHARKDASFILGNCGFYAMAALVAKNIKKDDRLVHHYAHEYGRAARIVETENYLRHGCDELFVGRDGYLCGALFFRHKIGVNVSN